MQYTPTCLLLEKELELLVLVRLSLPLAEVAQLVQLQCPPPMAHPNAANDPAATAAVHTRVSLLLASCLSFAAPFGTPWTELPSHSTAMQWFAAAC